MGTVNLMECGRNDARDKAGDTNGYVGDRGLGLKGLGPGGSILAGGEVIVAEVEGVVDPVVGGEEALGLARRLDPLHLPFSPARRLI